MNPAVSSDASSVGVAVTLVDSGSQQTVTKKMGGASHSPLRRRGASPPALHHCIVSVKAEDRAQSQPAGPAGR